jgi:ribonucleoside-diphosphate reductase beta chain
MGLFDERIAYKPFEYPEYYTEGWLKQAQAFWLHTEISMQSDVKDWNEKLNAKEKNLVGNIANRMCCFRLLDTKSCWLVS